MTNGPGSTDGWPAPGPILGVIFDIHSTLVDQGDADHWLDAALAVVPHPMSADERAELVAFLDRIWEGARISDPHSSRDLSFEDHSRVFHELIAAGPGVDRPLANALYDVMLDTWHAYDDTLPTLRALKEAGLRICLLSNAGVPIRTVLDREGVTPLVDSVVLSYEVGCVKPDHRIFQAALDALGLDAASVLMVGDNANDDGGGASLGLRTLILPRTTGPVHGLAAVTALATGVNALGG
jgi:HAD superfamily hydrolase (TIGR01549 family)